MFCSKCGATVAEGATFCPACGQAVGGVAVPAYAAATARPLVVYAGFWLRFVAWIIDRILLSLVTKLVLFPIFGFSALRMMLHGHPDPEELATVLGGMKHLFAVGFVLDWLYYALMESSVWQATLGKKTLGLRVTDLQGNRISFGRATGRFFARIISVLTLSIGYIMAGFTERKQALHDIIAGCLVIRQE
jgi:uncharacterized RDD family membrane protein YckC